MRLLTCLFCLLTLSLTNCSRSPYSPISAGSNVVRCYSRLDADYLEMDKALEQVWQHYPENRYDSTTIRLMRTAISKLDPAKKQPASMLTEAAAFKRPYSGPSSSLTRSEWVLKSANGKALYTLRIANCGVDTVRCDLCLVDITFLPPTTPLRQGNWTLTTQERAEAAVWFEQDILVKLKTFITQTHRSAASKP